MPGRTRFFILFCVEQNLCASQIVISNMRLLLTMLEFKTEYAHLLSFVYTNVTLTKEL